MDHDPHLDTVVPAGLDLRSVGPARTAQAAWRSVARGLRQAAADLDPAVELALTQGFVFSRRQLRDLGLPACLPRRLVRRGEWSRPRPGVLSPVRSSDVGPSGTGHEVRAAALALLWPGTVVSHASAAAMHGLPMRAEPGPPTLTARHDHRACSRGDVRLHIAGLSPDEIADWFGAPVTSVARTVVDLARERGVRDGLIAADAALHEWLTTPPELRRVLARQAGWPGVRAARRAVQLADGLAESPLESVARLCFADGGLPAPQLQAWIRTAGGRYRVDFLWPDAKVIVEVDGLSKYIDDWRSLAGEKRRQEHLERAGYRVIRLLWDDVVHHPAATVARIRAAL